MDDYLKEYQPVPTITGKPTYEALRDMRKRLKANAATTASARGGGANGYIGLVMTPVAYNIITPGTPFIRPPAPPIQAAMPNAQSTQAQISQAVREHIEAKRGFNECVNVEKALKKQVIDAIEDIYLSTINNNDTGFANVTLLAMINFLFQAYGRITPLQLEANDKEMRKRWDPPNTLIKTLIQQIEKGREFAADGNEPFTEGKIITMAFNNVFHATDYQEACRHWKRRPAIEKTWENFKTHFIEAQTEIQEEHSTEQAGYHGANAIFDKENMVQDQAAALANLATAVASDRQAFQLLTETNNKLTAEITTLQAKLAAALAANKAPTKTPKQRSKNIDLTGYCHTHGGFVAVGHNSMTCKTKAPAGHQDAATCENTIMGGNQRGL